jgi:hypothetical protein
MPLTRIVKDSHGDNEFDQCNACHTCGGHHGISASDSPLAVYHMDVAGEFAFCAQLVADIAGLLFVV